jgi:phenylacetate-CoA ligase
MVVALMKYYFSLRYWNRAPLDSIKSMQLKKIRKMFEHARKHSRFYREYYGDHGVLDLKIESLDDIGKVPTVKKAILKNYSTRDIMTCDLDDHIHIHSTSGSTGEPFKIAFNKFEDYTAHVRVYWALRKAGYRITDKIVMITRYDADDTFKIEMDISTIGMLQSKLNLFQREIISIYEPVDEIISKLMKSKARILWSTPSVMQIVGNRLKEREIRLDFPIIFLTSEVVSIQQKELFISYFGKYIVSLYGAIESPSLGFDFGLSDQFAVFPNSNYFEFERVKDNDSGKAIGKIVITNLINKTMPMIRYDLQDLAEMDGHPAFGYKYIKKVVGRQDDILDLGNGTFLAHHHAHEMFMDFHECEMFKLVQTAEHSVLLQMKIARGQEESHVAKLAYARWQKRFKDIPLDIEFVDGFAVNPRTGKFKNVEKAQRAHVSGNGQPKA